MPAAVNKEGVDWLLIKAKLRSDIAAAQEQLLAELTLEQYHAIRGAILAAKELIEWVEPTTPPKIEEETYGISDPSKDNYS